MIHSFREAIAQPRLPHIADNKGLLESYASIEKKALSLPYEPYAFQKESAVLIDRCFRGDPVNVLAASPTGSGKSFLIQWSAQRAWETGSKLVIVVPLVSLALQTFSALKKLMAGKESTEDSAQGYYDDEYGYIDDFGGEDAALVGIHTGSCEVNAGAQILVMTFEVLTIKMNNDFSYLDTVPLVIIDEIHFISDPERGCQVESIMTQLPRHTAVVGLSGTLPNALEFANNIGKATGGRTTHVVGKRSRPISLDYSVHVGDRRQPFVYLTRKAESPEQSVAERWKPGALRFALGEARKNHPKKMSFRQKRGRILQLIKDLGRKDKLPAMIVSFSCRSLNSLASSLRSIDLVQKKRKKAFVSTSFRYLKTRVPDDEWPLFAHLEELARRGIAVFHSQQPSLYCEIIPPLVKAGVIQLIFCTSSLSTGVDLPVRSVCLLELRRPSRHGFQQVEPSLMRQIFGRAGRPGQEAEGNAMVVLWEQPPEDLDLHKMLTAPTEEVVGHGLVRPRPLLSRIQRNGEPESLLRSPFSSRDTSFLPGMIRDAEAYIAGLAIDPKILCGIRTLKDCAESVRGKRWRVRVGDDLILSPPRGRLCPSRAVVRSLRPLRVSSRSEARQEPRGISWKRILYHYHSGDKENDDEERSRKALEALMGDPACASATAKQLMEASEAVLLEEEMEKARFMMTAEANPYYDDLQQLLAKLERKGFLQDGLLTPLGRMVPSIVGCDDALSLIVAWTENAIPRDSLSSFVAALSCFLQNKRNNQPADSRGIYERLCEVQESVTGLDAEVGTSMMEPMALWLEGRCVADIVRLCDSNPGHISKTVLRLSQLLEQLKDAGEKVGDVQLAGLCDESLGMIVRGLPFVKSTLLD